MEKKRFFIPIIFLFILLTHLSAQYASITRIDGVGAGSNFLELVDGAHEAILNGTFDGAITYKKGKGPVRVKIIDPLNYAVGNYQLSLFDANPNDDVLESDIHWELNNVTSGTTIASTVPISEDSEPIIQEFGLQLIFSTAPEPGEGGPNNGAIGVKMEYEDPNGPQWFSAIPDEAFWDFDYILTEFYDLENDLDPDQDLSQMGEGYFVPYYLCNYRDFATNQEPYMPLAWQTPTAEIVRNQTDLGLLHNVDLVFTSDKNKWTRCVVIETASPSYYDDFSGLGLNTVKDPSTDCSTRQFDLRGAFSVSKEDSNGDGLPDADNATDDDGDPLVGMGWFPGYAINVETGQRVNVFFGENSAYNLDQDPALLTDLNLEITDFQGGPKGLDMAWNPTDQLTIDANGFPIENYLGGQHYIYITNQPYDSCNQIRSRIDCEASPLKHINGIKQSIWASMAVVAPGEELLSYQDGLIPNDLTVKIRVDNPYDIAEGTGTFDGYPTYEFTLDETSSTNQANIELPNITLSSNPTFPGREMTARLMGLPVQCRVDIFNATGQLIKQIDHQGSEMLELDTPNNTGTYFVRITDENGTYKVLKWQVVLR